VSPEHRNRLAAFLAAEWRRLVRSVRCWLADTAERDAEDVVQDVALRLLEAGGPGETLEPSRDLSAYVYRALRNRVVDLYRRRGSAAGLLERLPAELPDERSAMPEPPQLRERLFAAIDRLPEPQRAVFLATELEGSTFRELSQKWGVPLGTLLARKHRAVKALRACLAPLEHEYLGGGA